MSDLAHTGRLTTIKLTHPKTARMRMFKRRQAKIPRTVIAKSMKEIIDLATYTPKSTEIQYWISELHLTAHDKKVLLDPHGWLTDNVINAAQELIKRVCPAVPGLQDVTRGAILSYEVENGEFVQIFTQSPRSLAHSFYNRHRSPSSQCLRQFASRC